MTANLKTTEVIAAVVGVLNGASLGFTPKIVQEGDLSYWVEREDLSQDLPAILVMCSSANLSPATLTGESWETAWKIRVLLIDTWSIGDSVRDLQKQRAEAIAQAFIGQSGADYDLSHAIAGIEYLLALPRKMDFEPAEGEVLKLDGSRRVYAVAVELEVVTESARV